MTSKATNAKLSAHSVKECECFDCMLLKGAYDKQDMQDYILGIAIYALLGIVGLLVLFLVARGSLPMIGGGLVIFALSMCGVFNDKNNSKPK